MATAQVDTRNLEWKDNNVGSKLLQKMGWQSGQGIGKRRVLNKSESDVSSEGLRVRRRAEGLGLGATSNAAAQSSVSHATEFAHVLQALQEEHKPAPVSSKRSSSKKGKAIAAMPTNKLTNARVREAKFQTKTEEDMKCIFAGTDVFASIAAAAASTTDIKKRKRDEKANKKKKKDKKSKKEKK